MYADITHTSTDSEFAALLVGRSVAKAGDNVLTLDDGTVLTICANGGCGGCPSGYYEVDELNTCDNVITSATLEDSDSEGEEWAEAPHTYRLFVFADNQKINLLTVSGDDGNGYYGSGFEIYVTRP